MPSPPRLAQSVFFGNEFPSLQRRLIVVLALIRSFRQLDFGPLHFLVWNQSQDMRDAIEPRAPLVIGMNDVPRRVPAVGFVQHHVAGARISIPAPERLEIHRAQFPLPQWVIDARGKPPLLLVLADLEPDLDQHDPRIDDVFFDLRYDLEKHPVLLLAAKSHDVFDAGTIVPTPIEDDDLTCRGESLDIALREHLGFLPIRGGWKRHDSEHARAYPLGQRLDSPAFAGGIAALEHDYDARALFFHPILEMAKLDLKRLQLLLVSFSFQLGGLVACCRSRRHGRSLHAATFKVEGPPVRPARVSP